MNLDRDPSFERKLESLIGGLRTRSLGCPIAESFDLQQKGRLSLEVADRGSSYLWVRAVASWPTCSVCRDRLQHLRVSRAGAAQQLWDLIEQLRHCGCDPTSSGSPDPRLLLETESSNRGRIRVVDSGPRPSDRPRIAVKSPARSPAPENAESNFLATDERTARTAAKARYWLPDGGEVEVSFSPSALRDLLGHCRQSNLHGREVAGFFVGYSRIGSRPLDCQVEVTDSLPAHGTESSESRIALGPEVWLKFEEQFAVRFDPQHKKRLGWFHTHPTQGIFFSRQDLDAHTVFTKRDQFAMVVDPRTTEASLFYWRDSRTKTLGEPVSLVLDMDTRTRPLRATTEEREAPAPSQAALFLLVVPLVMALLASLHFGAHWMVVLPIAFALVVWTQAYGILGNLLKIVRATRTQPRRFHLRVRRLHGLALGAGLLVGVVALYSGLVTTAGPGWQRMTGGGHRPAETLRADSPLTRGVEDQPAATEGNSSSPDASSGTVATTEQQQNSLDSTLEAYIGRNMTILRSGDSSVTIKDGDYVSAREDGKLLTATILGFEASAIQKHPEEVRALQSAIGFEGPNGGYGPRTLKRFVEHVANMIDSSADGTATLDIGQPGSYHRRLTIRRAPPGGTS